MRTNREEINIMRIRILAVVVMSLLLFTGCDSPTGPSALCLERGPGPWVEEYCR